MSTGNALQEALAHCIKERLTFVVFRVPEGPVTLWAQQTPYVDRVESGLWWEMNDVFLLSPFHPTERKALIRSDVELTFGDAEPGWHRLLECIGSPAVPQPKARVAMDQAQFERAVAEAQALCAQGSMEKVVLSRSIRLDIGESEAPFLFTEALRERTEACVVLMQTPEHGLWLGASPERLLAAESDTVHIDALAGTMVLDVASNDPAEWGEKERHEQRLVTKTIAGTLIDLGAGTIVIDGPEVIRTGSIAHLRTRISANVEGRSVEELVNALHPTPAICGLPKEAALNAIDGMEADARELYAGFWGPWSADGRMELFVNIRCMRMFQDHAELHVGAGITAGSVPAREWEETEHKADSWRHLLRTATTTRNA